MDQESQKGLRNMVTWFFRNDKLFRRAIIFLALLMFVAWLVSPKDIKYGKFEYHQGPIYSPNGNYQIQPRQEVRPYAPHPSQVSPGENRSYHQ